MSFLNDSEGTIYSSNLSLSDSYISQETDDQSIMSETAGFVYLDHSPEISQNLSETNKLQVYNKALEESNSAYKDYKINEFILNTYKELAYSNTQISQKTAKFVNDVFLSCKQENAMTLKSKRGECLNLLGLDDCNVEIDDYLTSATQSQFKENILRKLGDRVEKLKLKTESLKGIFGDHCPNQAIYQEEIPCQDKLIKFSELYSSLVHKINKFKNILDELVEIVQELLHLQTSNKIKELELKSISIIITKVKYMKYITSILEEKAKLLLNKSKDRINYLNTSGKEYELSVVSLREKLSNLKERIGRYRSKEKLSSKFAELVKVYGQTKLVLISKQETLSLLIESDIAKN